MDVSGDQVRPRRAARELSLAALLGLVIFIAVAPIVVLGVFWLGRNATATRAAETRSVSEAALSLAHSVAREIADNGRRGATLGSAPSLQKGDYQTFERLLRNASPHAEADFTLVDAQMREIINTTPRETQMTPSAPASEELRIVFATGRPLVTDLQADPSAQSLQFGVRTPVIVDNVVRYVLTVFPHGEALRRVVDQSYLPKGWFAVVLDGPGRVVARSSAHEIFVGRSASPEVLRRSSLAVSGSFEADDQDGKRALAAFHRVEDTPWRVLTWAPLETLTAPRREAERLAITGSILAILLSALAAFGLSRMVSAPMRRLVQAATLLGAGKRPTYRDTFMREANTIGGALVRAGDEISAREKQIRLVMRELSHRSKNLLSIIQAMSRQTGQAAVDYPTFARMFDARLAALSRSQDLLVSRDWSGGDLRELIRSQIEPFIRDEKKQLSLAGPALFLNPVAVQNIGMAMHELATNASKHGALSSPLGRIDIHWNVYLDKEVRPRLRLAWRESGGPETRAPKRRGFGRIVIEKVAPAALGGEAKLTWALEGLHWELDVPENAVVGGATQVNSFRHGP